jgi:hypothetical protein
MEKIMTANKATAVSRTGEKNMSPKTKHKSKSNDELRKEIAARDKLRRKRSVMIKTLAEANAALDAHLKIWNGRCVPKEFDEDISAVVLWVAMMIEDDLECDLAIAVNNLCYFDQEEANELGSKETINRFAELVALDEAAKGKASA